MSRPLYTSSSDSPDAEVNLTPLIDVVFVVLIMFIVVVPILELDRVVLAPGKSVEAKTVSQSSPLAIHVRQDNTIWIGKRQVAPDNLEGYLRQLRAAHPGVNPQLFHDTHAEFGTYQRVKNAVDGAGFSEMEVILAPNAR
ncbi:MAG: ExbD/TolR family protein [Parachlamydiales bacterium]